MLTWSVEGWKSQTRYRAMPRRKFRRSAFGMMRSAPDVDASSCSSPLKAWRVAAASAADVSGSVWRATWW